MFNFISTDQSKNPDVIAASATLLDDEGKTLGSVIFFGSEDMTGVVSILEIPGGQRHDSSFLHLRPGLLFLRNKKAYGVMLGGICVESW